MKTKLKYLLSLLFLMVVTLPVFALFPGNCLNFESGDYVSGSGIPASFSSGVTIEAWINHSSLSPNIQRYFTVLGENMVIRLDEGRLDFYIKASSGVQYRIRPATQLAVGQWYHVAGTYDGTTMKLYMNGTLVGSATTSGGMYAIGGTFNIGNGGEPMIGKIDDVRLWNVVRTPAEIANNRSIELSVPQTGLQSNWKFDESSGTTAIDACGHSNGTLVNMTNANWIASSVPYSSISGTVSTNTTWSAATINIAGDVTIASAATLTINPGVTVNFLGAYKLTVAGKLLAVGTEQDSIRFTGSTLPASKWKGIKMLSGSSGSSISYGVIENASADGVETWGAVSLVGVNSVNISYTRFFHNYTLNSAASNTNGGAAINCAYSSANISHCTFEGNYSTAANGGGAIYAHQQETSPYAVCANLTIENCIFINNTADKSGGAITASDAMSVNNCLFKGNVTSGFGGAVCIYNGVALPLTYNVSINNSIFDSNAANDRYLNQALVASGTGGAIYIYYKGEHNVTNCTLINNTATYGNDLWVASGGYSNTVQNFKNCIFWGSGIRIMTSIAPGIHFYYCNIKDMNAVLGACVNCFELDPLISYAEGNPGSGYLMDSFSPCINAGDPATILTGSALYDINGNPRFKTFAWAEGSLATSLNRIDVGAIEVQGDRAILLDGTVIDTNQNIQDDLYVINQRTVSINPGVSLAFTPGKQFIVNGNLIAEGTYSNPITFTQMTPETGWGGLSFDGTISGTNTSSSLKYCTVEHGTENGNIRANAYPLLQIQNCVIRAGQAENGGGVSNLHSTVKMSNCILDSNTAQQGGALYLNNPVVAEVSNCTVADNTSSNGGAIYATALGTPPQIRNSIFWANGSSPFAGSSLSDVQYCDIEGGYSGTGNINHDPEFTGEAANPYNISNSSFCINAGTADISELFLPVSDLKNNPRLYIPTTSSSGRIDMGAYEYQGYLCPGNFNASDGSNLYPGYVHLSWTFNPNYNPAISGFRVLRNGTILATTNNQTYTYLDYTALGGTIYVYQIEAFNQTATTLSTEDTGYIKPNGVISGQVKTSNDNPVMGVKISLAPSVGRCIQFAYNSSISFANPEVEMNQDFTLEMWVKTNSTNVTLLKSGNQRLQIDPSGKVKYMDGIQSLVQQDTSINVNDNSWHHIAMVNDVTTNNMHMYIDTIQVAETMNRHFGLYMAEDFVVPTGFVGYMDDIRIWTVVRDSSQIVESMSIVVPSNSPGLKGYWAMNEGTGSTLFDATNYAHNGVVSNCTWSSNDAGMSLGALTDGWGNYIISEIPYGSAITFTVTPSKLGHLFQPEQRMVTLSSSNIAANNVDFTDNSMIPISGYIRYDNSLIPVANASIWVNGVQAIPLVLTNADGYYVLEVEHGTACVVSAHFNEHTFDRVQNLGTVTHPWSNINFYDMFKTNVCVQVVGGIESWSIGTFDLALSSATNSYDYSRTVSAAELDWTSGQVVIGNVIPLNYNITIDPVEDPFNLANDVTFTMTLNLDLTNADAAGDTLRFEWRAPLHIAVAWPDSVSLDHFEGQYADSLFYVVTQNEWYSVAVSAFEDYSFTGHPNQKTYLTEFDLKIKDEIGTKGTTNVSIADTTVYVYSFVPHLPNIQADYARQYQKQIEFTVRDRASNRTVTKSDWALTEGVKPLESTFATTSPALPLLIMHDPPGDGSFASFATQSSVSQSFSVSACKDRTTDTFAKLHLGTDITFQAGTGFFNKETKIDITADMESGLSVEKKQSSSKEQTYTFTTSEAYTTSNADAIIGDGADVFVGAAINLVWGSTKLVSWDAVAHNVVLENDCMITPNGFATVYIYTDSQIRNTVIPNLVTIGDTTSANLWRQYLVMNEDNKANATTNPNHPGNYSFNAGPSYTYTESNAVSGRQTFEFEQVVSATLGATLGISVDGMGVEGGTSIKTAITLGSSETSTTEATTTSSFTLADDDITSALSDNSDYFSVDVGVDPQYGTPVFHLVSGASSCPWEPNTQPREGVMMTANTYSVSNLPMGSTAAFLLYLSNTSQTNEARRYFLEVMNATNTTGATVKINGATVGGRMAFDLEGGQTTQAVLTVDPGLFGYEMEDLTLEFYAEGDRGSEGPPDHYFDVFKSFDISWEAPYSRVAIRNPQNNWMANQALNDTLAIVLQDYDLTKADFTSIKLQYKHPQSAIWLPAFEVMRDALEGHPYYITVPWNISTLADGAYQLRATTTLNNIPVDWFTDTITGTIDRSSPVVWGLPQPSDGVLQLGDVISLTFTEDIDPNSIYPESVSVLVLRNQLDIDVNVQVNGSSVSIVPRTTANYYMENENVKVTVSGLKDMFGNPMAEAVEWEFYVNANPVAWAQPRLEIIKPLGQSLEITTYLHNSGGQMTSFTITDLPEWLTVNTGSGNILPLGSQTLVFTVSNQLGYGTFRDTVYADIPSLGKEPLIFEVNVLANPPVWATTQLDNFDYSMTITGQLMMEGEISSDANDIIGAFVLDANNDYVCRGYANIKSVPYSGGAYLFFLTIHSNEEDPEELYFRVWDSSTNKEHFGITESYSFSSGEVYGTPILPVTIHVSPTLFRSIPCRSGWNWISVNLLNSTSMQVNDVLATLSPAENDVIKSQTAYDQYHTGIGWIGNLNTIATTEMVKIKLTNPDELQVIGSLEPPLTTPLAYGSGWNWIGYLPHVSISVTQALANIPNPVTGDLIKNQTGYSQYIDGYGWFGSLLFMDAGKGYMLKTINSGSFTYPDYVIPREETPDWNKAPIATLREPDGW
jgi:hypothetical protein